MIESPSSMLKIKDIENSLKSLSDQIKTLGRSQMGNIKSIQKCFDECVPLIKSKIQESQKHFKIKRMYEDNMQEKQNRILDIKLKKYDDMRKKTNVKALIFSIKQKQATEIRDQSVKHNQFMKQQKTKHHEEKIKKSQKIKSDQSRIKQKIQSFHKQKVEDLSKIKKKQQSEKLFRIEKSTKLMESMNEQKISTHLKYSQTHASLKNLRMAIKKIKFMRPEEFSQIVNSTLNDTFAEESCNLTNPKKNLTMMTEASEFHSPIYGGQSRFTNGQQLMASKIIGKFLQTSHEDQKSFC